MQTPGKRRAAEVVDKVTEAARSIGTLTIAALAIAVSALILAAVALLTARGTRRAAA